MRTTLDLDEDVLQAAKELADIYGVTAGKMLSEPRAQSTHANRAGAEGPQRRSVAAPASRQANHDDEAGQRAQGRGVSRVALLDVNVLVGALQSTSTRTTRVAHDWFADNHATWLGDLCRHTERLRARAEQVRRRTWESSAPRRWSISASPILLGQASRVLARRRFR